MKAAIVEDTVNITGGVAQGTVSAVERTLDKSAILIRCSRPQRGMVEFDLVEGTVFNLFGVHCEFAKNNVFEPHAIHWSRPLNAFFKCFHSIKK